MAKAAGAILAALAVFWTGSFAVIALSRGPSVERVVITGPAAQKANASDAACPDAKAMKARKARAHAA
jgi:hypothetical protein